MDIILPGLKIRREDIRGPFFFLEGPHCSDWHQDICLAFKRRLHYCTVACPTQWTDDHPLMLHFRFAGLQATASYEEWAQTHLELAGMAAPQGAIIFWFPSDRRVYPNESPRRFPGEVFRRLLAWRYRITHHSARVVVGAERSYFGFQPLRQSIGEVLGPNFPVHDSVEATAEAAIQIALA